jgi:stearoyl-CoA desaturase (delta-9 desaturase)
MALGYAWGGWPIAISWLVWGVAVRMVFVLHSTWLVNSASHMWGYRNYQTRDDSRNNWWVALITYGEGWHNNHHAHPRMAKHGHKWWEFDVTFLTIRLMRFVKLAWDVVDYRSKADLK